MICKGSLQFVLSTKTNGPLVWTVKNNAIKIPAIKYRVPARIVVEAGFFCKISKNKNDSKWGLKSVYVVRDASEILGIQSTLRDSLIYINEVTISKPLFN